MTPYREDDLTPNDGPEAAMDAELKSKMCSFCGQTGSRKNRLAGGLGAMICMECLEFYYHDSRAPDRIAAASRPVWDEMPNAELLSKLPLILQSATQNSEFAHDWIRLIRARRISWAEIGKALGVSRQAAWERFGPSQARRESASGK